MKQVNWVWRRQITADQADFWFEQLAWIEPQRMMIFCKAGAKRGRIEIYGSDLRERNRLLKEHGGKLHRLLKKHLLPPAPRRPIRVKGDLYVVGDQKSARALRKKSPGTRTLLIPASMAFGSGEHATTGMVLRYLGKERRRIASVKRALDLGTGSGILALAARELGAAKVFAMDNCPDCVRISRENEAANFQSRMIQWSRADLESFAPKGQFDLVTANLFSELLITNARRITGFVAPGGALFLSGILKHQATGVICAFRKEGVKLEDQLRRGKWVMLAFSAT